ncbi:MAG: DNA-protecting protein DprA [Chloroflexi bacterium]|nr:DNA-protecting protein DprA [Chloroflexota bacterium]
MDIAWVALSLRPHIGLKTLRALTAHFGDTESILRADEQALQAVTGIGPKLAASIRAVDIEAARTHLRAWEQAGVRLLLPDEFPAPLADLADAPAVLFVRGTLPALPLAAVVGTRAPSARAQQVTQRLCRHLVARGMGVISGLARGVDTTAHYSTLAADGQTLAVLGSGALRIYPAENANLAAQILRRAALLSEIRPDAPPNTPALVTRNRLISGLAQAVFVIETDIDGGAMHAARYAQAQGRPLYVLDQESSGNRALLAAGARAFTADLDGLE